MSAEKLLADVWFGKGPGAQVARALLAPAEIIFRGGVALRNRLFDHGVLRSWSAGVPVISVGNLSVGGTGKTPMAAFLVQQLLSRGVRPALLARGYGRDEIAVHQVLNPTVPVLAAADRVAAARRAISEFGAEVLVLDDGFQHRRLRREMDVVMLAADAPAAELRMLPAGPMREPLHALARASLVVVARKAADDYAVQKVVSAVKHLAAAPPVIVVSLQPQYLVSAEGQHEALSTLRGKRVLTVTSIADPVSFETQLRGLGALVTAVRFRDHHEFSPSDVLELARQAGLAETLVCTLKDAVKLQALWPRTSIPMWYVSQAVSVEHGADILDLMLDSRITPKP